jgi:hypothetical protein
MKCGLSDGSAASGMLPMAVILHVEMGWKGDEGDVKVFACDLMTIGYLERG